MTSFKTLFPVCRVVIKSWGPGIFPGYKVSSPQLLLLKNRRKIEPKEIPSHLILCLLVVFTRRLEILVTTLPLSKTKFVVDVQQVSKNDHGFLLSVHASQSVSSSLPPSWPGMFHWDAPWEAPLIPKSVQHYGSLGNLLGSTAVQGNKNQKRPKAFTNLKCWNTAFLSAENWFSEKELFA